MAETATQEQRSVAPIRQTRTISDLLRGPELKAAISAALPKHLQPDRFIRVALNATMRQPDLLECTPESFFRCLMDLSALGIEADGRRAHLIPFWNNSVTPRRREVQLIIDYKGIAEMVRRSGDVSYIHCDCVYENDEWEFSFGSCAALRHKPNLADRGARVIAVYSFVKLRDGSEDFIVLAPGEVEAVRKRSKASGSGPWVTDWPEMAKKTAFRRHSKWLPLSAETRDVIERDDDVAGVDIADVLSIAAPVAPADTTEETGGPTIEETEQNRTVHQPQARPTNSGTLITPKQVKLFWHVVNNESNKGEDEVRQILTAHGCSSPDQIKLADFDAVLAEVRRGDA